MYSDCCFPPHKPFYIIALSLSCEGVDMERWEGKRLPLWWGERVEKSRGQERGKPSLHLLLQIPLEVKALLKLAGVKEGCTQRRGESMALSSPTSAPSAPGSFFREAFCPMGLDCFWRSEHASVLSCWSSLFVTCKRHPRGSAGLSRTDINLLWSKKHGRIKLKQARKINRI